MGYLKNRWTVLRCWVDIGIGITQIVDDEADTAPQVNEWDQLPSATLASSEGDMIRALW